VNGETRDGRRAGISRLHSHRFRILTRALFSIWPPSLRDSGEKTKKAKDQRVILLRTACNSKPHTRVAQRRKRIEMLQWGLAANLRIGRSRRGILEMGSSSASSDAGFIRFEWCGGTGKPSYVRNFLFLGRCPKARQSAQPRKNTRKVRIPIKSHFLGVEELSRQGFGRTARKKHFRKALRGINPSKRSRAFLTNFVGALILQRIQTGLHQRTGEGVFQRALEGARAPNSTRTRNNLANILCRGRGSQGHLARKKSRTGLRP